MNILIRLLKRVSHHHIKKHFIILRYPFMLTNIKQQLKPRVCRINSTKSNQLMTRPIISNTPKPNMELMTKANTKNITINSSSTIQVITNNLLQEIRLLPPQLIKFKIQKAKLKLLMVNSNRLKVLTSHNILQVLIRLPTISSTTRNTMVSNHQLVETILHTTNNSSSNITEPNRILRALKPLLINLYRLLQPVEILKKENKSQHNEMMDNSRNEKLCSLKGKSLIF